MKNKVKVKFQRRHPLATIPSKASDLAGGWDVSVTEIIKESEDFVICKLGFSLQPPTNYKVTLVPRSSLTKTYWILQNSPGLGDADYTGEYQFRFRAIPIGIEEKPESNKLPHDKYIGLAYPKFPYNIGDRIGQIYLEEVIPIEFIEVNELKSTSRGEGGYGSTNNN